MSKTSMNTSGRVCEKLLTGWNQFWLHVTTVRLLLCGRTLSRLAGGNFTACKQDWETAAQSTPEGCSLQPNQRKHVSLHLFRHTRTHCECEQEVTFICWGETENTWTFRIEIDTPPWHGQLLFPASDLMPLTQHFLLFSFFCCHSFFLSSTVTSPEATEPPGSHGGADRTSSSSWSVVNMHEQISWKQHNTDSPSLPFHAVSDEQ